jgi:hypothetical protein
VAQARLLTPPKEQEELSPFRNVWQSQAIEATILVLFVLVCFVLFGLLRLSLPALISTAINYALAVLPAALWLIFSYLPERRAMLPRERIGFVFFVSLLLANAAGIPLLDTLQPAQWLATESTLNRIIGYTLTVGAVQEGLKYLVMRYLALPYTQKHSDAIAYSLAVGIAYGVVLNLHYVATHAATPSAIAVRVLSHISLNVLGSLIVAYGFSLVFVNRANLLLMPASFVLACLLNGAIIPIRAGVTNAVLTVQAVSPRPIIGLGLNIALYVGLLFTLYFLFNNAAAKEES